MLRYQPNRVRNDYANKRRVLQVFIFKELHFWKRHSVHIYTKYYSTLFKYLDNLLDEK